MTLTRVEGIALRVVEADKEDDREGTEMGFAKTGREKRRGSQAYGHTLGQSTLEMDQLRQIKRV